MKDKYLIIDRECEDFYAVEISEHQRDAMIWLLDKLDIGYISFIRVDKDFIFKEI